MSHNDKSKPSAGLMMLDESDFEEDVILTFPPRPRRKMFMVSPEYLAGMERKVAELEEELSKLKGVK